jgi:hypothetical protein
MKYIFILLTIMALSLYASNTIFQNGISAKDSCMIGSTGTPDASALLELISVAKGFLPPRMTETQRDGISAPAEGLMIYNTDSGQIQIYNGAAWADLGFIDPMSANGDIIYRAAGVATALPAGGENQVLTVNGDGLPEWMDTQSTYVDPLTVNGDIVVRAAGATTKLAVGGENKVLKVISGAPAWATDAGGIGSDRLLAFNIISSNSDFELNATTGFTSSGTPTTFEVQGATVGNGSYSLSYNPDADGEYFGSNAYTIPSGLLSRNGVACIRYKGADSNLELNLIDGSANEISSTAFVASTGWTDKCVNFIFPASGTITARVEAEGDAAAGFFDDLFIGDANRVNISQISQAEIYGTKTWATTTNCSWSKTSNDWNAFSADTDCDDNARVFTGQAIADASNDGQYPRIRFASLPPGVYKVSLYGRPLNSYSSTGGYCGFGFTDGTTIKSEFSLYSTSTSDPQDGTTYSEFYTYTTVRGDTTFSAITDRFSGGGTCSLGASPSTFSALNLVVERFPLTSEIAYKPELTNQVAGVIWQNVASCTFTATGGVMTDADCNDPTRTYGGATATIDTLTLTKTNLKPGKYFVSTSGNYASQYLSSNTECIFYLTDGTTTIGSSYAYSMTTVSPAGTGGSSGIIEYTAFQPTITFSVYATRLGGGGSCNCYAFGTNQTCGISLIPLDQAVPLPNIMNNVTSPSNAGVRIASANLNCDSGSAITSQDDTWISSIGNVASGACAVTIASGIFSATPNCFANGLGTTKDVRCQINATSTTAATLYITKPSDGTDLTAADCNIYCVGAK